MCGNPYHAFVYGATVTLSLGDTVNSRELDGVTFAPSVGLALGDSLGVCVGDGVGIDSSVSDCIVAVLVPNRRFPQINLSSNHELISRMTTFPAADEASITIPSPMQIATCPVKHTISPYCKSSNLSTV